MRSLIARTTTQISALALGSLAIFVAAPSTGHAAACSLTKGGSLSDFFLFPACIINEYLIPIAIALEVVLFIFGIVQYIANADNQEERSQGSKYIMWGVIAIFVTLSFWALVGILQRTLQLG